MNDPLKKYIQDNRDDFDNLEPSADILFRLKKELKDIPKETIMSIPLTNNNQYAHDSFITDKIKSSSNEKKGVIRLLTNYKWMVAASIIITMSITYLLLPNHKNQAINPPQIAITKLPKVSTEQPLKGVEVKEATEVKKYKKQAKSINLLAAYRDLTDSTSASTRLSAILNIQKSTIISYDLIDKLAKTLNHDSNSNVRLAALNLMSKYAQDSYVNNAFMFSLSNQNDPLLQLGLIQLLSQTNNPKLDDKLYALANDPTTFSEVKDQAYQVLLNQNKL